MEEEDKTLQLEAEIQTLRQQLQVAQQESYTRKVELKRDRTFLGNELQRVRDKVLVTVQEKEEYQDKLVEMREQIKKLRESEGRSGQAATAPEARDPEEPSAMQAELEALQSQLDAIKKVWVVQEEQWSPGTLVKVSGDHSAMILTQDGKTTEHAVADLMGANLERDEQCIANLADLGEDSLKEPVVVETLLQNREKGRLFTFVGSVLLHLHDPDVQPVNGPQARSAYRCCSHTGELPPHMFSVLETAYRSMRLERQSQSVVLTGTNGAGKSQLFRSSLEFLVMERHVGNLHRILDGLTILESFGAAQNIGNSRSSRMSTLAEVQYDIAGTAIGASVQVYGLEKMRLTSQKDFNFAVFYQMCSGATEGEKKTLHLKSAAEFPYLNPGGSRSDETRRITNLSGQKYDSTGDVERYRMLKSAMSNIGLDSVMRAAIFRVLAAVLWLGKIEFAPVNPRQLRPVVLDRTVLDKAAHLLRCSAGDLETALIGTTSKQRGEENSMNDAAYDARDALAQNLYSRILNWLVEQINRLLSKEDAFSVVSVLDLVSFEAEHEDSTFDHFYRNYTTECVENLFNRDFFEVEEEEYKAESLRLPAFEFPSNQGCIDLMDRHGGFISLLDSECQFVRGSEVALIGRLNDGLERDLFYEKSRSRRGFVIKHWQDDVHYTTENLISHNQDITPRSVMLLMDLCKCKFLAELFPADKFSAHSRPVTLLTQLKNQVSALLRPLNSSPSTPYFVRCLRLHKPGDTLVEDPDSGFILAQLRGFRVPQMLQLRHFGFPVRSSFVDFYHRYRIFSESQLVDRVDSMYKQQCEYILDYMDFDRGSYQTGSSKVYLKEPQLKLLEMKRHELRERAALKVQKQFRTCRFLARFRAWRRHTVLVAPVLRGMMARQHYKQQLEQQAMSRAAEQSQAYNVYVREQSMLADRELELMREAFEESERWNIEWRRQRVEAARETAQSMFEKASQKMAEMDALLIRDFRAPDDIGQSTVMINHDQIADAVHQVVQHGNEEALKEHKRQLQEREDERKTRMSLAREEEHLRSVEAALAKRKWAHPLQELAWMRAEEQMQRIAEIVKGTRLLDRQLQGEQELLDGQQEFKDYERKKAELAGEEFHGDETGAPGGWFGPDKSTEGGETLNMVAALAQLAEGLVSDELERVSSGQEIKFEPEPPYVPTKTVFDIVELPDQAGEEEAEEIVGAVEEVLLPQEEEAVEHHDSYYSSLTAPESPGTQDQVHDETEPEEGEEMVSPSSPSSPKPPSPPPGPGLDSLTVEKIIDKRRQARLDATDAGVDMDTLFLDIDNELANIKHMYFDTAASNAKYEYVGKQEEPELDYKYRFKYKFRGVDAGLTDQDLQSLV